MASSCAGTAERRGLRRRCFLLPACAEEERAHCAPCVRDADHFIGSPFLGQPAGCSLSGHRQERAPGIPSFLPDAWVGDGDKYDGGPGRLSGTRCEGTLSDLGQSRNFISNHVWLPTDGTASRRVCTEKYRLYSTVPIASPSVVLYVISPSRGHEDEMDVCFIREREGKTLFLKSLVY